MDADLVLPIILVVLFAVAIFLAAAETAIIRVPRVRVAALAESGSRRARRLQAMVDDPAPTLNAILLAALGVQIGAATVAGILADRHFSGLGVTLVSVLLTLALFVYSEAIPKTYAVRQPARVAIALASPVAILERVLRPVVRGLVWFADLQAPGEGVATAPTVTEAELIRLSSTAADEGTITPDDALLIERAFKFGDRTAEEVMVPRPDIVFCQLQDSVATALEVALAAGHRRLPVCDGTIDRVEGIVQLRTLVEAADTQSSVGELMRPALFVPESKRIVELLAEMQSGAIHVAILVDEHGGTVGMATIEDIAEELLGVVADEGAVATGPAQQLGPGVWALDGRMPLGEAAETLGVDLPEGDWTTIAGMLMGTAGRVLTKGDSVDVDGVHFEVTNVRGRRILRAEARLNP